MSEKAKTRVSYRLEPQYDKTWEVVIYTRNKVATAKEGINMIKSMYLLEDPDDIDASIEIRGNVALDLMFGIGENNGTT